ncbi:MAG: phosphatidylserine decarboxylase [Cyanobacteria bacterium SBLK]|nr:phosphatidylserine decarboxylase [Cyanobacteria bacterium SBLK]
MSAETAPQTIKEFTARVRQWYRDDYRGFRTFFDAAIENVKPIPEDTDRDIRYDWRNKSIDDLCSFFDEWYAWLPEMPTGLDYIRKFGWLYYQNEYGRAFVTKGAGYEMTKHFVAIRGEYFDSPESAALIHAWVEDLGGIHKVSQQYIIPEPTNPAGHYGFNNFNQFFSRKIKPDARAIASPEDDSVVVAPADCMIYTVENLTQDTKFLVKTSYLNVRELLNDSQYMRYFDGGTAVFCILKPHSYHHYHAPVSGKVVEAKEDVSGEYFGVAFERFRRGYLVIKTERYGHVGVVPVGLTTIASVVFRDKFKHVTDTQPIAIAKGEAIGYFQYGGSLNILLFEAGRFPSLNLLQGQQIGFLLNPDEGVGKLRQSKSNDFLHRVSFRSE